MQKPVAPFTANTPGWMIDGTDTAGNQTQRFTVENGAVDKILITFDAHSHGTVVSSLLKNSADRMGERRSGDGKASGAAAIQEITASRSTPPAPLRRRQDKDGVFQQAVRRQIGSHQHGGNSARGLETESAQQSQQSGRTSPAGAASAIAKPGFEKGWSITTRQRPSWCFSQSDELAHIIKRHPPTPSRVDGV